MIFSIHSLNLLFIQDGPVRVVDCCMSALCTQDNKAEVSHAAFMSTNKDEKTGIKT